MTSSLSPKVAFSWPASMPPLPSPNLEVRARAEERQAQLTKPAHSLGLLEDLAISMAAFQNVEAPSARPCSVLLFAADHPVTAHGVSPYPSNVTAAMVKNFEAGGAAASVLSRASDLPLLVVDAGVAGGPVDAQIPAGDLRTQDALSPEAFAECVERGARLAREHAAENRVTIFGEMGIGNTTVAAAVCAALFGGEDPADYVGSGTGAQGALLDVKRAVVRAAVGRLRGDRDPLSILRRVGGREMVHILGAMRQVLGQRSIVLVDGFIVTAVAAVLLALEPEVRHGLVFSHRSGEQAHGLVLDLLGVRPLLDLDMRLGEASGALLAYPVLERACQVHNQMATFASARVAGPIDGQPPTRVRMS